MNLIRRETIGYWRRRSSPPEFQHLSSFLPRLITDFLSRWPTTDSSSLERGAWLTDFFISDFLFQMSFHSFIKSFTKTTSYYKTNTPVLSDILFTKLNNPRIFRSGITKGLIRLWKRIGQSSTTWSATKMLYFSFEKKNSKLTMESDQADQAFNQEFKRPWSNSFFAIESKVSSCNGPEKGESGWLRSNFILFARFRELLCVR